jgi:hypothetical protein
MPRGGFRANAGRKADPNSARQRKLAARAEKTVKPRTKPAKDRGLTAPDGTKKPEAGADWPFGTTPPADEEPAPEAAAKTSFATPLEYWGHVLQDPGASASAKHAAAYAMAPYVHAKVAPMGKKEGRQKDAAKAAGSSRFKAAPAPLALVKR